MTAKKLSKYTWNTEEVLTSAAMTAIGTTINNLIDDVAGITPTSGGLTEKDIKDAIDEYDALEKSARLQLEAALASALSRISDLEDGNINIDADNEVIKSLKQGLYSTFIALGLAEEDEDGNLVAKATFATTGQIDALNQLVGALQSASTSTQTQVGLMANWYELLVDENGNPILDENGNKQWVPKYDGASIIAAINDKGQTDVQINADRINLNGYVTTDELLAVEAKIDKLDVSDTLTANSLIAKGENDYPVIKINATDGIQLQMNERGDTAISVNIDGSGSLANGGISWNSQGDLTVNGTFRIGAAYIEYITEGLSAVVGFDERQESLTANIEITNSNNFDIYCIYRWYADGINSQWSTGDQSDAVLVKAHESRTFTHTVLADDILKYRLATHPSIDNNSSGADIVSAYRYIQRS